MLKSVLERDERWRGRGEGERRGVEGSEYKFSALRT